MTCSSRLASHVALFTLIATGCAFHTSPPSSQTRVRVIQVDQGVRLEVVDWGGTGKTIILLAGGGNTAHVFEDFAPRLAATHHVIGITRRGFGASTFAPVNRAARLADDVLAVMDSLKLGRAFIVGHSIAGAEVSALATRHPERAAGLIYLDAAYPYAFRERDGPTLKEFMEVSFGGPRAPIPRDTNLASFAALQRWDAGTFGFQTPESEFRQTWDSTADGRPTKARDAPGIANMMTLLTDTTWQPVIRVPSLVIFAIPHVHEPWMDARDREAATEYFAKADDVAERQAKSIEKAAPNARVIRLRGMHYLYLSNTSAVIREIRAFTARLD